MSIDGDVPDGSAYNTLGVLYDLMETKESDPLPHLEKVLRAPARPGREIGDAGRRAEARALIERLKAK